MWSTIRILVCLITVVTLSDTLLPFTTSNNNLVPMDIDLSTIVPPGWSSMCRTRRALPLDGVQVVITCHVTANDTVQWRLADLRTTLGPVAIKTGIEVAVELKCGPGANISLPFPMRAPGLVKLKITSCQLLDKYSDFNTSAQNLSDTLRILEMRDCTWLNKMDDVGTMLMLSAMTNDFDCGQDSTLVEYIYSNVQDEFIEEESIGNSSDNSQFLGTLAPNSTQDSTVDPSSEILKILENIPSCNYPNLQVLDESRNPFTGKHEWEMMQRSSFPVLRVMNYSRVNLTEVPVTLLEWRRFFKRLNVLDLSRNSIKKLTIPYDYQPEVNTTFILRHNKITQITMDDVENWVNIRNFYVDIRNNSLNCNCDIGDFLLQLRNDSLWTRPIMAYYKSYIPDMTCATPPQLAGRTLRSLSAHELPCPMTPLDLKPVIVVLVVVAIMLLVLLLIAVRYRREVRILVFTRAHVMLPCGRPLMTSDLCTEKKYDAFVSYAHQDCEWVTQTLCPRLEQMTSPTHGRPIKLCIHQRDFVVGKPIIDNIIDCIAASRHTIIVLTPSFVQSSWAMEELQQAFRQSMEERRRHLLLVVLETVPQSDMAPVLRRCCKTFTYLEVSDTLFWDRLVYSLHVDNDKPQKTTTKISAEDSFVNIDAIDDNLNTKNGDVEINENVWTVEPIGKVLPGEIFVETMRTISVDSTSTTCTTTSDDTFMLN